MIWKPKRHFPLSSGRICSGFGARSLLQTVSLVPARNPIRATSNSHASWLSYQRQVLQSIWPPDAWGSTSSQDPAVGHPKTPSSQATDAQATKLSIPVPFGLPIASPTCWSIFCHRNLKQHLNHLTRIKKSFASGSRYGREKPSSHLFPNFTGPAQPHVIWKST